MAIEKTAGTDRPVGDVDTAPTSAETADESDPGTVHSGSFVRKIKGDHQRTDVGLLIEGEELSPRERAARRRQWRESSQCARLDRFRRYFLLGVPTAVVVGIVAGYLIYTSTHSTSASTPDPVARLAYVLAGAGIVIFIYLYVGTFVYIQRRSQMKREFRDDLVLGIAKSNLNAAEEAAISEGDEVNFASLWFATQKRLDYYHKIATTQARESFRNAQIAAGCGFAVLIASAIVAGVANSTSASIVAGATGVFGGALGAFLGSTFVRMQQEASTRLRAYFLQPLEFSRALAAERLVQGLDGDAKDSAVRDIVVAVVRPGKLDVEYSANDDAAK